MRSRSIPIACLVAALAAAPALAQPSGPAPASQNATQAPTISPSHLALAQEVAVVSGITRSLDVIPPQFFESIRQQVVARPELTKDLNEVFASLDPEMELQKKRAVAEIGRIFAQRMTEAELKDVLAFFKSPSGRKYVEAQPLVLDDMVKAMQNWSQELAEYVMVRVRAEMGKRGHVMQ